MPKKAASKKGAASKKKAPASAGGASDKLTDKAVDNAAPTAHEISLRLELEGLEAELAQAKTDVETARKQNTWLHGELERVAEEMSDYKLFVTKKTSREAEQIEGLNARGQQQLDNISADRARRVAEFEKAKKDLQSLILARESDLERVRRQIDDLAEVRILREQQLAEIARLEAQISELHRTHTASLLELKAQFLRDKIAAQRGAQSAVAGMVKEASREAAVCLEEQTTSVRAENRELRRRLLAAITTGKSLQEREQTLQRQQRSLQQQADLGERVGVARLTSRPSIAAPTTASPEQTNIFRHTSSGSSTGARTFSATTRPALTAATAPAATTATVTNSLSRLSVNPPGPRPRPPSTTSPARVGSGATRSLLGRF